MFICRSAWRSSISASLVEKRRLLAAKNDPVRCFSAHSIHEPVRDSPATRVEPQRICTPNPPGRNCGCVKRPPGPQNFWIDVSVDGRPNSPTLVIRFTSKIHGTDNSNTLLPYMKSRLYLQLSIL